VCKWLELLLWSITKAALHLRANDIIVLNSRVLMPKWMANVKETSRKNTTQIETSLHSTSNASGQKEIKIQ